MTVVEFANFAAMAVIFFTLVRLAEIWGPSWVSRPLGVIFHA